MPIDNTYLAITDSEVDYLSSSHVGDTFKLYIAHPVMPIPQGAKVPVIYVLDAALTFGIVTQAARLLQFANDVPNAYVVGIDHGTGMLSQGGTPRFRDFTPTRARTIEELHSSLLGIKDPPRTGGGPAFLRFMREELEPHIESRFAVDPNDTTLVGLSLSALFCGFVLLNEPESFKRYVICSPSLFYDNDVLLMQEAAYAAVHDDLEARVFLACGSLENEEDMRKSLETYPAATRQFMEGLGRLRIAEPLERLAGILQQRSYPGLRLTSHIFPDEHHNSVFPAAASRGLRSVFAP